MRKVFTFRNVCANAKIHKTSGAIHYYESRFVSMTMVFEYMLKRNEIMDRKWYVESNGSSRNNALMIVL